MKALKLGELSPGMVLAKSVYNYQDVLLLNEGIELSEKSIWILRSWGVTNVWVEGDIEMAPGSDVEPEDQGKEIIEKQLKEKFSEVLGDQVMVEIMRVARKHLEKRLLVDAEQEESN